MSDKLKEVDIWNRTSYFFDDMINMKNTDPNKIKVDENHTEIFLFHTLNMSRSKNLAMQQQIV